MNVVGMFSLQYSAYLYPTYYPIGNYLLASYKGDITPYLLPANQKILCIAKEGKMMLFVPCLNKGTEVYDPSETTDEKMICSGNKGHQR